MKAKEMIGTGEAARIRGIHRNSILKAAKAGTLRGQKVADRWLFRRDDVESWEPIGHRPKKEVSDG